MYPTPPDSPDGPSDTKEERGGERQQALGYVERMKGKREEERKMLALEKVWLSCGLLQKASCQALDRGLFVLFLRGRTPQSKKSDNGFSTIEFCL